MLEIEKETVSDKKKCKFRKEASKVRCTNTKHSCTFIYLCGHSLAHTVYLLLNNKCPGRI